jgi:acyl carrier protein
VKLDAFLELISEALDCEDTVKIDDSVDGIIEWDSLGILSLVDTLDTLGVEIELEEFERIVTVRDFVELVNVVDSDG